ncbi:helix-turn-helix transcriptional regulator [Sphaerisporangium aureirubrum]|uniref:Helix-turn-helix transcriptional regulator n=1 Tax=Sphaerisporangium aureirubrum TaxID=1544736 RepID=A0ABW1NQT9_9ACTN
MDSDKLLGDFLRARREVTSPDSIGLIRAGRRRTPGLRREEIAMMAGVSTDYYIRLEQGRERRPSEQVLGALARVLNLDAAATDHLFELAHPRPRRPARRVERVSPGLLSILRGLEYTPAFVLGRWMDVLAANRMTRALYDGLEHNDNLLRLTFLNPESRGFYVDWEVAAATKAALLRGLAGTDPDDPYLPELVDELCDQSPDFRRMWARHDVDVAGDQDKRFHHRLVGDLTLTIERLFAGNARGQQLVVFQAEPGSSSEYALGLLRRLLDGDGEAGRTHDGFPRPTFDRLGSPAALGGVRS